MVIIVAALIIISSILGILALGNKAMAKKTPLRVTMGECVYTYPDGRVCGNGIIEFTGWEDSEAKYTHDEYSPFEAHHHTPKLPDIPEDW